MRLALEGVGLNDSQFGKYVVGACDIKTRFRLHL